MLAWIIPGVWFASVRFLGARGTEPGIAVAKHLLLCCLYEAVKVN